MPQVHEDCSLEAEEAGLTFTPESVVLEDLRLPTVDFRRCFEITVQLFFSTKHDIISLFEEEPSFKLREKTMQAEEHFIKQWFLNTMIYF